MLEKSPTGHPAPNDCGPNEPPEQSDPSAELLVGVLRLIGLGAPGDVPADLVTQVLDDACRRAPHKIEHWGAIGQAGHLIHFRPQSEDDAQLEANLIAGEIARELAARVPVGPDFRAKIIVVRIPTWIVASATKVPDALMRYIGQKWEEKKVREREEALARRQREFASPSEQPSTRPRGEWKAITYIDKDIDNALSQMTAEEIDHLPFGVIKINAKGTILEFNAREAQLTNLDPKKIIGRNFFRDIAPCTNRREFLGRFIEGTRSGRLDVTFNYLFDFRMKPRRVKVHLKKSYFDDTYWILVEMNEG